MDLNAILLTAGVGRRLQPFTNSHPKVLLEVAGRTLLDRHLDALAVAGVHHVVMVVGHCQDQVRSAVARRPDRTRVTFVENPEYTKGSILSLHLARHHLDQRPDGALVMDADVLYPAALLQRLLAVDGSACLMDTSADETGEEMMVGARGGRVHTIDRRVGPDWDIKGESVGFFHFAAADAPALRAQLELLVGKGKTHVEYEDALRGLFAQRPVGFALVNDVPWTEIDFEQDVSKAQALAPRVDHWGEPGVAASAV